jgi:tetratricopeptide (TPR) repeat protein
MHYALADGTTQTEIAQAFGVSVSTLAMRARAIVQALHLEELDDRYADPFDPRVRYRHEPQPMAITHTAATAAIRLAQEARDLVDRADWSGASAKFAAALAASPDSPDARNNLALTLYMDRKPKDALVTALPVLERYPDNVFTLALLAQCHLALSDRQQAAAYAEQAKAAYQRGLSLNQKRMADQHRLVELLGQLEDDEGILTAIGADKPEQLDALTLRRGAIALARADRRLEAIDLLHAAQEKGAPLHLVAPLIGALELMEARRIPAFKLDYTETLSSLLGLEWQLSSLTKSQLVCGIFFNKAKEAVQAVKAVGAQRDPWAPKLLRHLAKLDDLPKTVQDAVSKALNTYRWR